MLANGGTHVQCRTMLAGLLQSCGVGLEELLKRAPAVARGGNWSCCFDCLQSAIAKLHPELMRFAAHFRNGFRRDFAERLCCALAAKLPAPVGKRLALRRCAGLPETAPVNADRFPKPLVLAALLRALQCRCERDLRYPHVPF